jgi:hypothetical protein
MTEKPTHSLWEEVTNLVTEVSEENTKLIKAQSKGDPLSKKHFNESVSRKLGFLIKIFKELFVFFLIFTSYFLCVYCYKIKENF